MRNKFLIVLSMPIIFGLVCVQLMPQAAAQAVYGSIFGTITDPSGAAVPGAKVTVTSATKGTTFPTPTTSERKGRASKRSNKRTSPFLRMLARVWTGSSR